jgi:hypothetical protein
MTAATRRAALDHHVTGAIPPVTEDDARSDREWFAGHPDRRFRARPGDSGLWLIRRRPQGADPDVYLRTFARAVVTREDSDRALAALWYGAAYPSWPPEKVQGAARKAVKKGRKP